MLMARARPDGLPRPLNMYRRVLSLRLSSFRLSIFTFRRKQRQRLVRALVFVYRSARDTSRFSRRRNGPNEEATRVPTIESDYERLAFGAGSNLLDL